jgi:hypothetical protein
MVCRKQRPPGHVGVLRDGVRVARGTVLCASGGHWEFLTIFLEKSRYNAEAVLKNCELFVYGDEDREY